MKKLFLFIAVFASFHVYSGNIIKNWDPAVGYYYEEDTNKVFDDFYVLYHENGKPKDSSFCDENGDLLSKRIYSKRGKLVEDFTYHDSVIEAVLYEKKYTVEGVYIQADSVPLAHGWWIGKNKKGVVVDSTLFNMGDIKEIKNYHEKKGSLIIHMVYAEDGQTRDVVIFDKRGRIKEERQQKRYLDYTGEYKWTDPIRTSKNNMWVIIIVGVVMGLTRVVMQMA